MDKLQLIQLPNYQNYQSTLKILNKFLVLSHTFSPTKQEVHKLTIANIGSTQPRYITQLP